MTRYITPAMRQRDEIAWQALVAGANASQSERAAEPEPRPIFNAYGQRALPGEIACIGCDGQGWVQSMQGPDCVCDVCSGDGVIKPEPDEDAC